MPHDDLIERAKLGSTYFTEEGGRYRLKTPDEYMHVRIIVSEYRNLTP